MIGIPSSADSSDDNFLEIWDALLSRQPAFIQAAYQSLDPASRQIVLAHLTRMVTEPDWHPEQVLSAQSALNALNPPRS